MPDSNYQIRNYQLTQLPNSKEGDLDLLPFFDALVSRNLNVAVCIREARDLARPFERRHRHSPFDRHRVELQPAGLRDDPSTEWDRDRTALRFRQPRCRTEERDEQDVRVRQ